LYEYLSFGSCEFDFLGARCGRFSGWGRDIYCRGHREIAGGHDGRRLARPAEDTDRAS
jgi:hypothetical protein